MCVHTNDKEIFIEIKKKYNMGKLLQRVCLLYLNKYIMILTNHHINVSLYYVLSLTRKC